MTTKGHDLILRDVTFAYGPHSDPVLRNLNLTVPAGDHLAIVGPSGIGKSTLASLLCGLRQPTSGTVQVGDTVAADLPPDRLAEIRTLIPQEAYVFAATVWDNLTYLCPTATPRQVDNAAAVLGAEPFIAKLGGMSAELTPSELSAGERQLIALVRSYISPAPVVVLDEATCHLDPGAERRVEEAFAARRGTLIVIAHRVSSALRARRILVLDGTTAAVGDHETLLVTSSLYRELLGHWQVGSAESGKDRAAARRLSSSPSIVVESTQFDSLPVREPVAAAVGAAVSSNGSIKAPASGAPAVARLRPPDDGPAPQTPDTESTTVDAAPEPAIPVDSGGLDDSSRTWIFGQVSESGTSPVEGATLTLTDLAGRQVDRDVSDAGGHYRLGAPSGGSYLVICASDAHQPTVALVAVTQVPVRHDVVLSGGGASLSGCVSTAEEGRPIADAVVTLVDGRGDVAGTVTTEQDGRFDFADLAQGHYTMTVRAPSLQPVAQGVEIPAAGSVTRDVRVSSRVQVVGVVRSATTGLPVAEALATLIAADGQVVGSTITDAYGGFVFDDVTTEPHTIIATGYPPVATEVNPGPGAQTETVVTLRPPALPDVLTSNGLAHSVLD